MKWKVKTTLCVRISKMYRKFVEMLCIVGIIETVLSYYNSHKESLSYELAFIKCFHSG